MAEAKKLQLKKEKVMFGENDPRFVSGGISPSQIQKNKDQFNSEWRIKEVIRQREERIILERQIPPDDERRDWNRKFKPLEEPFREYGQKVVFQEEPIPMKRLNKRANQYL